MHWWHWLLIHISQETGTSNESSRAYAFWSGFGSDIGEVAIIGGMVAFYRRHTCHVGRCWRWAKHPVEGTPYTTCAKHHPRVPRRISAQHIRMAHVASHKRKAAS